ncbi:hypothetical protein [Pectinatus frisingensis]|uniref:hypothetical protein n=1 Tax=Pectinatus frisingensis TaxID=865 RepID=UPI0018C54B1A|nr:hypothetical protein [Pectinatus frisingensis]
MWIVSQDKTTIVNTDTIACFNIDNSQIWATYGIASEADNGYFSIGKYSDKQIYDVFRQLTNAITNQMDASSFLSNKFEMPGE